MNETMFRLMVVSFVVVVTVAVKNVSEKSILSSAIFHRSNISAGLFYCVFTDYFFACKAPAKKYDYRMQTSRYHVVRVDK